MTERPFLRPEEVLEVQRLSREMNNQEISDYLDLPVKLVAKVFSRLSPITPRVRRGLITPDFILTVKSLLPDYSNTEIAFKLNVSTATVRRAMAQYGFSRTQEQESAIRSRLRKDLIRKERALSLFGLNQKTRIKVWTNKERNVLRNNLRRRKYIVIRNDLTVYYDETTRRSETFEERGRTVGLSFSPLPSDS